MMRVYPLARSNFFRPPSPPLAPLEDKSRADMGVESETVPDLRDDWREVALIQPSSCRVEGEEMGRILVRGASQD